MSNEKKVSEKHICKKGSKLSERKIEKIVGGVWSTELSADCHVKCNNPNCVHFGHYVSTSGAYIGGEYYKVCDYCNELITTPYGDPIPID